MKDLFVKNDSLKEMQLVEIAYSNKVYCYVVILAKKGRTKLHAH